MKKIFSSLLATACLLVSMSSNATVIDFAAIADTPGSEGSYDELTYDLGMGAQLVITANDGFPYLDGSSVNYGKGGLGVCPNGPDVKASCGSDDNVTEGESLTFTFVGVPDGYQVMISQIWFNNNHDEGILDDDLVNISFLDEDFNFKADGTLIESGGGNRTTWAWVASDMDYLFGNESFQIGHVNQEFYVQAIALELVGPPASVPEPANLALLSLGLFGLVLSRKKLTLKE